MLTPDIWSLNLHFYPLLNPQPLYSHLLERRVRQTRHATQLKNPPFALQTPTSLWLALTPCLTMAGCDTTQYCAHIFRKQSSGNTRGLCIDVTPPCRRPSANQARL